MENSFGALFNRTIDFDNSVKVKAADKPIAPFGTSIDAPKRFRFDDISTPSVKLSNFTDIFKASDEILKRKSVVAGATQSTQPGFRLFSRPTGTSKDATLAADTSITSAKALAPREYEIGAEKIYDVTSKKEIDALVNQAVERGRLEAERVFLNKHALELNTTGRATVDMSAEGDQPTSSLSQTAFRNGFGPAGSSPESYVETLFAETIETALEANADISHVVPAIKTSLDKLGNWAAVDLWEKGLAVCGQSLLPPDMTVEQFRDSKAWMRHVVTSVTGHFEKQFQAEMDSLIAKNRSIAQRGGIPGTLPTIEAFLNVSGGDQVTGTMNGIYGSHPIWSVLFQSMRIGDYAAASTVASAINSPANSNLMQAINNISKGVFIDSNVRIKLSAEWNHEERTCTDMYKKAVYSLLLDLDYAEPYDTLEEWLWSKLVAIRFDIHHAMDRFSNLQRQVTIEWGEDYFLKSDSGGSPTLYHLALLLSGQIERAIEILVRYKMHVHAVHLAIVAYASNVLLVTTSTADELLVPIVTDPTRCRLNFARLIVAYVKRFELTNVSFSLNYCFFLHKFVIDANSGTSLFEACVSRLFYMTKDTDAILGTLQPNGTRKAGLIDRFGSVINVRDIIARVALDTSLTGDNLTACCIYCIAELPTEAAKLISRHLSITLQKMDDTTTKAVQLAEKLIAQYEDNPRITAPKIEAKHLATLKTLLAVYDVVQLFHSKRYADALTAAKAAKVIPLDPDLVQAEVDNFKLVPEDVCRVLSDLALAIMESVVKITTTTEPSRTELIKLQQAAKAVVMYVATIPHRLPVAVNSKLLQLQSQVA